MIDVNRIDGEPIVMAESDGLSKITATAYSIRIAIPDTERKVYAIGDSPRQSAQLPPEVLRGREDPDRAQ